MINDVLEFLQIQMDNYLHIKLQKNLSDGLPLIQLSNVAWNDNENTTNTRNDVADAFITLVNVEEDRISQPQKKVIRRGADVEYMNPKVYLNLYLLFSVNATSYIESLKKLSLIIQFFQYTKVFTKNSNPSLPDDVDELIFDLYSLSFMDLNNLWGILGAKYLPSVVYKLRLVVISENFSEGSAPILTEISVND